LYLLIFIYFINAQVQIISAQVDCLLLNTVDYAFNDITNVVSSIKKL